MRAEGEGEVMAWGLPHRPNIIVRQTVQKVDDDTTYMLVYPTLEFLVVIERRLVSEIRLHWGRNSGICALPETG